MAHALPSFPRRITRYEYPASGIQSKVYSTLIDTPGSTAGPDTADEVLSESFFDGAGRMLRSRRPHTFNTNGTTATWAATLAEYDILGRVKKQSVPTEVDASWDPAGDDLTRGFLWTHQKYDWMGRVIRKINTDGIDQTTLNASDVLISYEGCGCAGGLVTTIQSEEVPRTDTTGDARRKQKSYQDILGRTFKTEMFEWDGSTVYSTVVNTFNGRDQVVQSRQYAGSTSSTTFQDTTASFDGHGRLSSSHRPEQRDGTTLKYTTYSYNPDDSIQTVTDARGAVTTYTYNSRGLVTGKAWTVPGGSGITDPADVSFAYDNLGNRTSMTDGQGSVTYAYDPLSRLTSETRTFSDTLVDKPTGNFNILYEYTMGGLLRSYTDPYGEEIEYSHDKAARLGSVDGTSFGGVTNYAGDPGYHAWGALKHLEYGSGFEADITYDSRLRPATYKLDNTGDSNPATFDRTYEYYSDGRLKLLDNVATDALTTRYDRFFSYDHAGRVKDAKSGTEATGTAQTDLFYLPYRQTYTYNALGNLTGRESTLWNYTTGDWDFEYDIANNRVSGHSYDHDGRETSDGIIGFGYDASGAMVHTVKDERYETLFFNDGDGRGGKRSQRSWDAENTQWKAWETVYFIYSSVMGKVVSETTGTGKKKFTYVYAGGAMIARQSVDAEDNEHVAWKHTDPSGLSSRSVALSFGAAGFQPEELDGLGNNVGIRATFADPSRHLNAMSSGDRITFDDMTIGDCELDGVIVPCSMAGRDLRSGGADIDWRGTDSRALFSMLGIIAHEYWVPHSGRTRPELPPAPPGEIRLDTQVDGGAWLTGYHFFAVNWNAAPISAAINGQAQENGVRLTDDEVEEIRDRVLQEVSSNKTCAEFIEKLAAITLGKAVGAKDLLNEGLDRAHKTLGVYWKRYGDGVGGAATSHALGSPHEGVGEIWFSDKRVGIVGLIHEILHVGARANDVSLSQAVKALGIQVRLDNGTVLDYPKDEDNGNLAFSGYWGQALKNHCGPNTLVDRNRAPR